MTKYIKTNGAIYKIEDNNLIFDGREIPIDLIKLEEDYKIAGTIVELCECVISKRRYKKIPDYDELTGDNIMRPEQIKILLKYFADYNMEWIKLGIWTDKGLKYIAELNEKGEFELI